VAWNLFGFFSMASTLLSNFESRPDAFICGDDAISKDALTVAKSFYDLGQYHRYL
jgi:hypothetical protein